MPPRLAVPTGSRRDPVGRPRDAAPVRVQVGGMHAVPDESLGDGGAARPPVPGVARAVSGADDSGAVELVAVHARPGWAERRVSGGDGVPVAERELAGHL